MVAGIRIRNSSNTLQIDENYRNACLVNKVGISLSHSFGTVYVDVVQAGARVLMAMESANYSPFLFNTIFDGTNWTYRWGFYYLGGASPVGDTAYAWVFNYLDSPPGGSVGIRVKDAAGAVVFHSNSKPMRIAPGGIQTHPAGFTGTGGRKIVPLVLLNSFYTQTIFPSTFGFTYGLRSNGNVISADSINVGATPAGPSTDGLFAAVDVTHY